MYKLTASVCPLPLLPKYLPDVDGKNLSNHALWLFLLKLSGPLHFSAFQLFSIRCASVSLLWGIRAEAAVQQNMPATSRIGERPSKKKLWRILQSRLHHGDWETRPNTVKPSQLHGGHANVLLGYIQILQPEFTWFLSFKYLHYQKVPKLQRSHITHDT